MVRPIPIIVDGQEYASRQEAASFFGIPTGTFCRRINSGWTPEQAAGLVAPPKMGGSRCKPIEIEGKIFVSAKAAAAYYGIDSRTFSMRLARGDSTERAAGVELRARSSAAVKRVSIAGKTYQSIKDACAINGVRPSVFSKRVNRGWTPEQAGGFEPPPSRSAKPVRSEVINGTEYPLADAGEYLLYLITNSVNDKEYVGITTNGLTLRFRGHLSESRKPNPANPLHRAMAKHGADKFKMTLLRKDAQSYVELMKQEIEEIERRDAFRKGYNATYGGEIPPNALQLFVNGKTYPTLTSAANAHGLDPRMVNLRVQRLGWSVERALEIDHSIKEEKQVFVGGVRYSSLKRAAAILGQQYKTVHARVTRYGWTPEQALGVVPPPKESKSVPKAVIVDGMRFPSQAAAARHYGISPSLVTRRVRRSGLSLQEALTMPKTRKAAPDQKK